MDSFLIDKWFFQHWIGRRLNVDGHLEVLVTEKQAVNFGQVDTDGKLSRMPQFPCLRLVRLGQIRWT